VFEADGVLAPDEGGPSSAWSVILDGRVRAVTATDEFLDTFAVPLFPWHSSPKPVFVRLEPASVSGRRFLIADESTWDVPFGVVRRSDVD
jgi:hypothetical protein